MSENETENPKTSAVAKFDPDKRRSLSVFTNIADFESSQRMATALSRSAMVPATYQGKVEDVLVALDIAQRMDLSPLIVMQHLYIVHGRPAWDSQYCLAAIHGHPRYAQVDIEWQGARGSDDWGCKVTAHDTQTGKRVEGTLVTMKMAKQEGWTKNTKWASMPEQMLQYRAATFFARVRCSDALLGLQSRDEIEDVQGEVRDVSPVPAPTPAAPRPTAPVAAGGEPPAATRRRGRPVSTPPSAPVTVETTAAPAPAPRPADPPPQVVETTATAPAADEAPAEEPEQADLGDIFN